MRLNLSEADQREALALLGKLMAEPYVNDDTPYPFLARVYGLAEYPLPLRAGRTEEDRYLSTPEAILALSQPAPARSSTLDNLIDNLVGKDTLDRADFEARIAKERDDHAKFTDEVEAIVSSLAWSDKERVLCNLVCELFSDFDDEDRPVIVSDRIPDVGELRGMTEGLRREFFPPRNDEEE